MAGDVLEGGLMFSLRRSTLGTFLVAATFLAALGTDAATITVNSPADTTADDGQCTLREAIISANMNTASGTMPGECAAGSGVGTDLIQFGLPSGLQTITVGS